MVSFCLFTAILMTFFVILNAILTFIHVDEPCACGLLITGILAGYIFWISAGFVVINDHFDVTIKTEQVEKEKIDADGK